MPPFYSPVVVDYRRLSHRRRLCARSLCVCNAKKGDRENSDRITRELRAIGCTRTGGREGGRARERASERATASGARGRKRKCARVSPTFWLRVRFALGPPRSPPPPPSPSSSSRPPAERLFLCGILGFTLLAALSLGPPDGSLVFDDARIIALAAAASGSLMRNNRRAPLAAAAFDVHLHARARLVDECRAQPS